MNVDGIRIPGLATDYSLRIGGRGVIVLATQASWFRSNWSLAHELGHLALDHHSAYESPRRVQRDERAADAFAAALLISPGDVHDAGAIETGIELARAIWKMGVSTEALRHRLSNARVQPNRAVAEALQSSTPRLLRDNVRALDEAEIGIDLVTQREQAASARRFPLTLLSALRVQTEIGAASPLHLAWTLDVPVDDIEFPEPDDGDDRYERMLDDRPNLAHWQSLITGSAQS